MVMEEVLLRERLLIAYTLYCTRQHDEILATLVLGPWRRWWLYLIMTCRCLAASTIENQLLVRVDRHEQTIHVSYPVLVVSFCALNLLVCVLPTSLGREQCTA